MSGRIDRAELKKGFVPVSAIAVFVGSLFLFNSTHAKRGLGDAIKPCAPNYQPTIWITDPQAGPTSPAVARLGKLARDHDVRDPQAGGFNFGSDTADRAGELECTLVGADGTVVTVLSSPGLKALAHDAEYRKTGTLPAGLQPSQANITISN